LNSFRRRAAFLSKYRRLRLAAGGALLLAAGSAGRAQLLGLGSKPPAAPVVIPTLQPPVAGYVFPERQTLTFTVDWRVFTAGTAVFHLERVPAQAAAQTSAQLPAEAPVQTSVPPPAPIPVPQTAQLKVTATADTVGAVNMLFPVVDRFQSALDTRTGCSAGFAKQLQEGRRKVSSDLTFDYTAGKQTQLEKNLVKGTEKQQTASIPACVTDSLSAIFYAASQRLTVGQDVGFPLADAMRTVTVTMKVEAKEEIKTPAGTFQTVRVQPTAEEGIVKNRGNIWIWYTDDARHMPVQIRAHLFWGTWSTITFHLQSVEAK
jgi:hypothetical protein